MDENETQNAEQPNELPTNLAELSGEQLAEALASAREEAQTLSGIDAADLTDEQVTRLEQLADFVDAVATENAAREQAQADRAQRAQAAAERLQDGGDEGTEGDGEGTGDDGEGEGDGEQEAETTDAVAAGATRTTRAPMPAARRQPTPSSETSTGSTTTIVASAGLNGTEAGAQVADLTAAAEHFIARSKGFPQGVARQKGVRHQLSVVSIHRNHEKRSDGLYVGNSDFATFDALIAAAGQESRLSGQSLVAAGGWCAPSTTDYGIESMETLDGIIDLPTVGVPRGGLNYTPGPDFADIFATAGFFQTEAEAIAGDEKNCVEVDCPDFTEVRLDAVGVCVKAPLLTRAAYPEVIRRWLEGTLVANQHKVAARLITGMRTALGTALAPTLTGTPITWSTLTALELIGEGQRQAYRLSEGQTLEVIAPRWLRIAIRADLANRMGIGAESVTNAQIQQHFADRGLAVQWVLNYLELSSPLTNVAFPATAEVMVYPAGTFVKGEADVIDLDTVYDTADLQTNVYTAAFAEDGVLLAKRQHGGKRITLPVSVTGMLGAAQLDDSWGSAQVETAGV